MSLQELMPKVSELSHEEKVQLNQWLARELESDETVTRLVPGDHVAWTPYGSYETAAALGAFMERQKALRNE
jgi:hypothetical protein